MFDFDISKMALIGVVALVVLGPERLPRVARTAGALLGRAQRYINDVKSEVTREIEIEELRKMKTGFEEAASTVHNTIHDTVREHTADLTNAWNNGSMVASDPVTGTVSETAYVQSPISRTASSSVRRNWRSGRRALPAWYKHANLKRTRLVSGAAREALAARQSTAGTADVPDRVAPPRRTTRFL